MLHAFAVSWISPQVSNIVRASRKPTKRHEPQIVQDLFRLRRRAEKEKANRAAIIPVNDCFSPACGALEGFSAIAAFEGCDLWRTVPTARRARREVSLVDVREAEHHRSAGLNAF